MDYSSKIWRVSLCREMSASQEFGAQDVFKNKCLIYFRWYRSTGTPPNRRPRASDRVANPRPAVAAPVMQLCQQRHCDDGRAAAGSPLRCVRGVLHGFLKAAWKRHWLFLLSHLTWKAILFTPFFFFLEWYKSFKGHFKGIMEES